MSRNRAIRLLTFLASLFVAGPTFVGLGLTGLVVGSGTALLTAWASYLIWAALTVLIGNALVTLRGTPRLAERQLAFVTELAGRQHRDGGRQPTNALRSHSYDVDGRAGA